MSKNATLRLYQGHNIIEMRRVDADNRCELVSALQELRIKNDLVLGGWGRITFSRDHSRPIPRIPPGGKRRRSPPGRSGWHLPAPSPLG